LIGFLHSGSPLEKRLIIPDSIRVRAESRCFPSHVSTKGGAISLRRRKRSPRSYNQRPLGQNRERIDSSLSFCLLCIRPVSCARVSGPIRQILRCVRDSRKPGLRQPGLGPPRCSDGHLLGTAPHVVEIGARAAFRLGRKSRAHERRACVAYLVYNSPPGSGRWRMFRIGFRYDQNWRGYIFPTVAWKRVSHPLRY